MTIEILYHNLKLSWHSAFPLTIFIYILRHYPQNTLFGLKYKHRDIKLVFIKRKELKMKEFGKT